MRYVCLGGLIEVFQVFPKVTSTERLGGKIIEDFLKGGGMQIGASGGSLPPPGIFWKLCFGLFFVGRVW